MILGLGEPYNKNKTNIFWKQKIFSKNKEKIEYFE